MPDSAPKARKAHALQLKGYLLFFDQLLANYLTQLGGMRQLFSLSGNSGGGQTYFVNKPQQVPDLQKLLRFGDGSELSSSVGKQGAIQAFPVNRQTIEELVKKDELWKTDPQSLDHAGYGSATTRDTAVFQAIEDLNDKNFSIHTVYNKHTDCWFFYIYTAADDLAFISNRYYATEEEATLAASNVCYVGTFKENFRKYIIPKDKNGQGGPASEDPRFSFDIELNMAGYYTYLQQIVEDKQQYAERRKLFLDHLLARFCESFTDFALLSWNMEKPEELALKDITQKEKFLSSYNVISRNRGRAFDYKANGWNNNNISGFEHRVQALAGVNDPLRHSLCHFELKQYPQQFFWTLPAGENGKAFNSPLFFDSVAEAKLDAQAFLQALKEEANYKVVPASIHDGYEIVVHYKNDKVSYPLWPASEEEAEITRKLLLRAYSGRPVIDEDVFVSHEIFKTELENNQGHIIRRTKQAAETPAKALSAVKPLIKKINEEEWETVEEKPEQRAALDLKADRHDPRRFIDIKPFTKNIFTCPDEYRWYLDNEQGELILKSHHTYPSAAAAIELVVKELTEQEIGKEAFALREEDTFFFFDLLTAGKEIIAVSSSFHSAEEREQAIGWVIEFCRRERTDEQFTYLIKEASRWKVSFGDRYSFESVSVLADPENAINSWRKDKVHFRDLTKYEWKNENEEKVCIVKDEEGKAIARLLASTEETIESIHEYISNALLKNDFRAGAEKISSGYSFRIQLNAEQTWLSGYEVYESRGAAFSAMLEAFEKASKEDHYLRSGDEGNRQFTFLLKKDDRHFLAEHAVIYDSRAERDAAFSEALEYFANRPLPVKSLKDPEQYSFMVSKEEKELLQSTRSFKTKKEADDTAVQILLSGANEENWQLSRSSDNEPFTITLWQNGEPQAIAKERFVTPSLAGGVRKELAETIAAHVYQIKPTAFPDKWKFRYHLGFEAADNRVFTSQDEFGSREEAIAACERTVNETARLQSAAADNTLKLSTKGKDAIQLTLSDNRNSRAGNATPDELKPAAAQLSALQRLHKVLHPKDEKEFEKLVVKMDDLTQQGTYVYRLVKKDEFFAWHRPCKKDNAPDPDELIKEIFDALRQPLHYLEICLGGDNTDNRKDASGSIRYHYLLKARNSYYDANKKEELVLFKSTRGYSSSEEAQEAFNELYLTVLKRGSKSFHYGQQKYISFTEQYTDPVLDRIIKDQAVVFVPKKTIDHFGGEAAAVAGLTELCKSYPVRASGKDHYRFSLYDYQTKRSWFIGSALYDSPQAAMQAFEFLLILKKNRQNFYSWCDPVTGRNFIVLREILAESTSRFPDPASAWGAQGVEKFIGVSQTPESTHFYVNGQDCCYSFFVACKSKVIHPCTYDTAPLRNKALKKLIEGFKNYELPVLPDFKKDDSGEYTDVFYKGELITRMPVAAGNDSATDACYGRLFELLEKVQTNPVWEQNASHKRYVITDSKDQPLAILDAGQDPEKWMNRIVQLALAFPLYRKNEAYYFRLPWPPEKGKAAQPDDLSLKDDCGCGKSTASDSPNCYIAFQIGCYNSCREALEAFRRIPEKLANEKNYRQVFDCICGKYRIEFIEENEIIAFNPQCYSSPAMVCEAADRAKKLINDEGIFVVEHILLRPHCETDCGCLIPNSPDPDCAFTWEFPDDDPCLPAQKRACFVPGEDPYSFIATVVLPAWPTRFNNKANRRLIEKILYREAPAHVLLRILWLSPRDLCAFETRYKDWTHWLANKKNVCKPPFDVCDLIRFLFSERLHCWEPELLCEPCRPTSVNNNCVELETADPVCALTIGDVFGWETGDCCDEHPRISIDPQLEKERVNLIRKRTTALQKQLTEISAVLPDDKLIGEVSAFINSNKADEKKLQQLTAKLYKNISKTRPAAEKAAYENALKLALGFYLDRALLDEYNADKLGEIKRIIRKLPLPAAEKLNGLSNWNSPELQKFVHPKTVSAISNVIRLTK